KTRACQQLRDTVRTSDVCATPVEHIGDCRQRAVLVSRIRRFADDGGRPTVVGFLAVGDCDTVTNPLYGRGCSLAAVQAVGLAAAYAEHPGDAYEAATSYEAFNKAEVEPWYDNAVMMDQLGADPSGRKALGGGGGKEADAAKA